MLTNVKIIQNTEQCTCKNCGQEIPYGYLCKSCEWQEREEYRESDDE